MPDSFAEFENSKSLFVEGLNERIVSESIPLGDFSQLLGLRQNRLGELLRYPGEARIELSGLSSIRGLYVFGEYVIIQTAQSLVRARFNELFPDFPQTTPELFPDNYDPPGSGSVLNPEDMSYALISYQLPANTDGAAVGAGTWNVVPFNTEIADSDNRVTLAAGTITITAGSYPAYVRFDGNISVLGPQSVSNANSNQRCAIRLQKISGGVATVANGCTFRMTTANSATEGRPATAGSIKGRYLINGSTDFLLQVYTSQSGIWGKALNLGAEPEMYAQLEILIEE